MTVHDFPLEHYKELMEQDKKHRKQIIELTEQVGEYFGATEPLS